MKEVDFKFITIQNFLSIGDETIRIDLSPGIHIITGNNNDKEDSKNGVGKSSIADAFFFALFGSPLRQIKKDSIANWANNKKCVVSLEYDVTEDGSTKHYEIVRTLKPNKTKLVEDGVDISRTTPKTNQTIVETIGTDSSLFEQSVIMCLNQVEPFLAKTPAVKRKFIEDIFTIEIFGKMTKHIREDHNDTQRSLDSVNNKMEDLKRNIELWKKQQEEQAQKKKRRVDELSTRKKDIEEEIVFWDNKKTESSGTIDTDTSDLKEKIKMLNDKERLAYGSEKELVSAIATNKGNIRAAEGKVSDLKRKIKDLENLSEGSCAYCKQPFAKSDIAEKKKLIKENQTEIERCEDIISDTREQIEECQTDMESIETAKQKIIAGKDKIEREIDIAEAEKRERDKIDIELKNHKSRLSQVQSDLEDAEKETDSSRENIEELNKRLSSIEENIIEFEHKLAIIDAAKFIVSDEGVKNFIVKKMLKMMNGRLNFYLKKLDANCTCEFNEYFDEIITNNRGHECSYFNFSGGERKRIDLAMLFTFNDIRRKQSNVSINMSLYDELLDTALDAKGIELTLEILNDRVLNNDEAIYVISHKSEAIKHATGEVIYLEKENDITKRKPYE